MSKKKLTGIFGMAAACALSAPLIFGSPAEAQDTQVQQPAVSEQTISAPSGGDLSYLYPWVLLGLGSLPLIWWLRRNTPPRPTSHDFPPIRILEDLKPTEETPAKTPPWQLLLSMSMGAAAIIAMAEPHMNPAPPLEGNGPVRIIVDNGYSVADDWDVRRNELSILIDQADSANRQVILLTTAPSEDGTGVRTSELMSADQARETLEAIEPHPWFVDHQATIDAIQSFEGPVSTIWISNGLDSNGTQDLAALLKEQGDLRIITADAEDGALLLDPPDYSNETLSVSVRRTENLAAEQRVRILAHAGDGRVVEPVDAIFAPGETSVSVEFDLPPEIRNQLTQISIEGESSAGAVILLDERWRHRPVGILAGPSPDSAEPLLDPSYYVEEALRPYADLRSGDLDSLLEQNLSVMLLMDSFDVSGEDYQKLDRWIRQGGLVLRFAGPDLADSPDELLPVDIIAGQRDLGGAMSWSTPARISAFDDNSPFYGLDIPENVVIETQVLARPDATLNERVWARLEDGTPLISAERRGDGLLLLVHTTADPRWSNLAISGLFVDMLRKVVTESRGVIASADGDSEFEPWQTLSAGGTLQQPSTLTQALNNQSAADNIISPQNPPGLYCEGEACVAHNLSGAIENFEALGELPDGTIQSHFSSNQEVNLKGPLLTGAFALLILDMLIVLGQRGMLPGTGGAQSRSPRKEPDTFEPS